MSAIRKHKLNNKGFSHVELVLLIVVIAVIAGVGFFVYNKNNNKSKADSMDSAAIIDDTPGDVPAADTPDKDTPAAELSSDIAPVAEVMPEDSATAEKTVKVSASSASYKRTKCYSNVIVLDPGHSPTKNQNSRDTYTGLFNMDYANEPEIRDAWTAAIKIRKKLSSNGYRVALTKSSAYERINLSERAQRANSTHGKLLVTLHSDPGGASMLMYPDGSSIRTPKNSSRKDGKNSLVYPGIVRPSETAAKKMAPIIAKELGMNYKAKSFYSVYGRNGLGGNGKNNGNTPVQTILSSIPQVYNEVPQNRLASDRFASAMTLAIETAVPASTCR
jgi:N-acetylmuramoyl-L-alanine amidase